MEMLLEADTHAAVASAVTVTIGSRSADTDGRDLDMFVQIPDASIIPQVLSTLNGLTDVTLFISNKLLL